MSASLTTLATDLVADLGYGGVALGLVLDSLGAPIASEVLVPIAVVAATEGRLTLWVVVVVALASQVAGAAISWALGRRYGLEVVARLGRYVLISPRHVARTERVFARHGGWMTAAGRCVPVVRGLIGYPAGAAGMGFGRFVVWTALGTAVWTTVLVLVGELVAAHLAAIDRVSGVVSTALGAALVLALVWAAWLARRRRPR